MEAFNILFIFIYFFEILFIYSWENREREAETQVEGEAGSMQGAQRGTRSGDSRITPWAEGRYFNCWATQVSQDFILFYFFLFFIFFVKTKILFLSKLYSQCGAQIHKPETRVARSTDWASQVPLNAKGLNTPIKSPGLLGCLGLSG